MFFLSDADNLQNLTEVKAASVDFSNNSGIDIGAAENPAIEVLEQVGTVQKASLFDKLKKNWLLIALVVIAGYFLLNDDKKSYKRR